MTKKMQEDKKRLEDRAKSDSAITITPPKESKKKVKKVKKG